MVKKNNSLRHKVLIAIFSFIFFLGMLEIGLRITANFYFQKEMFDARYRRPRGLVNEDIRGSYVILCVGDSFTRGDEVAYNETYPVQLQAILNSKNPHKKFVVINQGICGYNTRQLLKFLPGWLRYYQPDLVIILDGATNRFNPWGYNLNPNAGLFSNIRDKACDLKVYKMLKLIVLNLRSRMLYLNSRHILSEDAADAFRIDGIAKKPTRSDKISDYYDRLESIKQPLKDNPFYLAWFYYNTGKIEQAIELGKKIIYTDPYPPRVLCTLGYFYLIRTGEYQKAAECYKEAVEKYPPSEFITCNLVFFYREAASEIYLKHGKYYDLAVENFLKAIELDPQENDNYYGMSKAYDMQSRYDSEYIFKFFQDMLKADAKLKDNKLFMNYLNLFSDKQGWEGKIKEWMENDLEAMVNLCQSRNVKLVMQNYPISYPMANNLLRKVADKHSLPFVENCSVFDKLISQEKRRVYLLDDDHCTQKGHHVMAENIYRVLAKERICAE